MWCWPETERTFQRDGGVLIGCGSLGTEGTRALVMSSHATEEPRGTGTAGAELGTGYPCVVMGERWRGQCERGRIFRDSSREVNGPFRGLSKYVLPTWPCQECPPEIMTSLESCEKVSFALSLVWGSFEGIVYQTFVCRFCFQQAGQDLFQSWT